MGKYLDLSWTTLKKNPMLLPLLFCVGFGTVGSAVCLLRAAVRSPDVAWFPKTNPEPWNEYRDKNYKFITIQDNLPKKSPAPEY
ncbi:NADH dehydrogenase [ubiquinone] 1 alpha subcomplex subunit 4-like 2 [Osmia bicornis bicornis]|uniref:NADH dehydrogenase [ubiquinone] 1 alpha subcomplex subunit 4-like 2 n=1 Tax=Osmia bicornis bicornis TaxID=1437191 RepID=UPI0010F6E48D|nr:NADH dehydrogenase [ubiquinone] 1 alpha subcomplex subunit 4-like 2 [Osmia bicornis bicornis]